MVKSLAKIAAALILFCLPVFAFAQSSFSFPVQELGGCESKEKCRVYCDAPEHMADCADFAAKKGLISGERANTAKQFSEALLSSKTPGGCETTRECVTYCDNVGHIEECLSFAEKLNLNTQIINDARNVIDYLRSGGDLPGECDSQTTCLAYCLDPKHIGECVGFAMLTRVTKEDVTQDASEENIKATTTENASPDLTATTTPEDNIEEVVSADTDSDVGGGSFGGAGEDTLSSDADVAPEVFRFTSFPEETVGCLKERLGEHAEEEVSEGTISTEELRTAVESCILEALSEEGRISVDELLQENSSTSIAPLKSFAQNMLAIPIHVADHILRFLKLKE